MVGGVDKEVGSRLPHISVGSYKQETVAS